MANLDRGKDFPATSIGRTAGSRLPPSVVQESHPLGPHTSIPELTTSTSAGFPQKYRAYTPRTRGGPTPSVGSSQTAVPPTVTPGTLIHPPSPQHHQPAGGDDATTKLQLTNAKAEAQGVGLDTHTSGNEGPSVGWAMLEKIVCESETGELWTEIWNAITAAKATLLLPVEALSQTDKLAPEFFKDHIAFCDSTSSASQSTPIVTLSGLRGLIHNDTITFTSTLHPSSPLFHSLLDPSTRASSLRRLPPLASDTPPPGFPYFTITTHHSTLPLPPKTQTTKPPLPPRPGARPISNAHPTSHISSAPSSSSRILNPFASLFGNRPSTPTPIPPPPIATASPPASIKSLEPSSLNALDPHAVVEIEVIVIDTKVSRRDVERGVNNNLRREIKTSLSTSYVAPVPDWITDRVLEFCEPWFPFIRAPKTISSSKHVGGSEKGVKEKEKWVVNMSEVDQLEDTVEFIQDFYAQLEDNLRVELNGDNGPQENEEKGDVDSEVKIRSIMESVENTVCSLFYDRLFAQPQTDDSSHDTTLSNRIAALNLLDLTLEHLDIAVEESSKTEVENVVKDCGKKLCELDKIRIPKQKARILVEAHQVIVDGLSMLPPVRLMSAEESKALKERQSDLLKGKSPPDPEAEGKSSSVVTSATITTTEKRTVLEGSTQLKETGTTVMRPELSPLSLQTTSELSSTTTSSEPSPRSNESSPISNVLSLPPKFDIEPPPPPKSKSSETETSQPKAHKPTPVSSDVLLPMLIFSVVKANPPHFVSNLLYLQRFRRRNAYSGEGNGEESFCLINMLAVAEFLEGVDLEALGLGARSDVSATDLTPIIARSPNSPIRTLTPKSSSGTLSRIEGLPLSGSLRGKVEQQVDAIAGSANKVISGVVDSSFGILRSFLPQNAQGQLPSTGGVVTTVPVNEEDGDGTGPPTAKPGPGFGLLRKDTGFSIASIAASLPVPGIPGSSRNKPQSGEEGQQLITVTSRPGSIKSTKSAKGGGAGEMDSDDEGDEDDQIGSQNEEDSDDDSEDDEDSDSGASEEDISETDDNPADGVDVPGIQVDISTHPYASSGSGIARNASASAGSFGTDTRSIRSFETMLSDSKKRQKEKKLKQLAKANEKERKKEQRRAKNKVKEGKNVSISASKTSTLPRKSLTDRLASVGALASGTKGSPPDSRRSSLLQPPSIVAPVPLAAEKSRQLSSTHTGHGGSPISSRVPSPGLPYSRSSSPLCAQASIPPLSHLTGSVPIAPLGSESSISSPNLLAPPHQKFLECSVDELSIREVGELLNEYRRLVAGVKQLGGFAE